MSNPKRRGEEDQDQHAAGGGGGGDKRLCRPKKHLYLVLADRDKGYSIHKIDVDTFHSDDHRHKRRHHLFGPPVLRLELRDGAFFSALGTKIFALTSTRRSRAFDTETGELSIGPRAPAGMDRGFGIAMPVGDTLYALSYENPHSLHAMAPAPEEGGGGGGSWGWDWKALPAAPPEFRFRVNAYALHPDGHTVFMTAMTTRGRLGTYSLDTRSSRRPWRCHGQWALPFMGRAHYDGGLGAWVGVHAGGYVCTCQVPSPTCHFTAPVLPSARETPLEVRTTMERLFICGEVGAHTHASLVSMGGAGRFCLVERVVREREGMEAEDTAADHRGCVIRLTIFGLEYDDGKQGELHLHITSRRSTRSFKVSSHISTFGPVAFWL